MFVCRGKKKCRRTVDNLSIKLMNNVKEFHFVDKKCKITRSFFPICIFCEIPAFETYRTDSSSNEQ